jgi:hypothetical protein
MIGIEILNNEISEQILIFDDMNLVLLEWPHFVKI